MYNLPTALADVLTLPSPLERITVAQSTSRIWCKRDDLIHPIISGNKWRKLSASITSLVNRQPTQDSVQIISFGGGYSNHLHALAYVCCVLGYEFTAIVRGHYSGNETPCLQDLKTWGCHIKYLDKTLYKSYTDVSQPEYPSSMKNLQEHFPRAVIIPEGGYSIDALAGSRMCISEIAQQLPLICKQSNEPLPTKTLIVTPVATGSTLAGLVSAKYCDVLGIAVLRGHGYLEDNVTALLSCQQSSNDCEWSINHDYVSRGYAKSSAVLDGFIQAWNQANPTMLVEPCYSGKALWGLVELENKAALDAYSDIIFLHTGGLQGARTTSVIA